MTVPSTISRNNYTGSGTTGPFPYGFQIFAATHLLVTKQDAGGNTTTLTYGTDYSVSGVGSVSGGSVTLSAVLPSGYKLTLRRVLPLTQLTDLRNQQAFYAETLEQSFDQLVQIAQQHDDQLSRCMTVAETDTAVSLLPPKAQRANQMLGFDSNGNPITAQPSGTLVSSAMQPVVQASTLALGWAALGIAPILQGNQASIPYSGTTGLAVDIQATGPGYSGTALNVAATDANFHGNALAITMPRPAASLLGQAFAAKVQSGTDVIYSISPFGDNDVNTIQFTYAGIVRSTTSGGQSPIIHKTNLNCKINSGVTVSGEILGQHTQICRTHDVAGDDGTLAALTGHHITVGHDAGPSGTATTTSVIGQKIRLRRNQGTIGNIFGIVLELKEAGATITGNCWGIYDDSQQTYGAAALKHMLSGPVGFGNTSTPSESVHVFAGNVSIDGTTSNTLKVRTATANGSVAATFTANSAPTGAATSIQTWIKINVQGTDRYIPCW